MSYIYALHWEQDGSTYIGQTTTTKRFADHLSRMRHGVHGNYKIQKAYDSHGEPECIVLEYCNIYDLDRLERRWIDEFDSINNGLNISDGTVVGRGVTAPNSRYSKKTILKIFSMLYRTTVSCAKIEARLKLKLGMPSKISHGECHLWLKEDYPEQYSKMLINTELRQDINRDRRGTTTNVYPDIVDPNGVVHAIPTTIKDFCISHPLLEEKNRNCISELISGVVSQYKGFRIHTDKVFGPYKSNPPIKDPDGQIYNIEIGKVAEFCRTHPLLKDVDKANVGISAVLRKAKPSYRGFRL